jgi:hypothetical protein
MTQRPWGNPPPQQPPSREAHHNHPSQQPQQQGYAPQQQYQQPRRRPSAYERFAGATPGHSGYLDVGVYVVRTIAHKVVASERDGQDVYIHEFEVVRSSNESIPPGSTRGDAKKFHPQAPQALERDIKTMFVQTLRARNEDILWANDPQWFDWVYSGEGTALAGTMLKIVATRKEGKKFTQLDYMPAGEGPAVVPPQAPPQQVAPPSQNAGPLNQPTAQRYGYAAPPAAPPAAPNPYAQQAQPQAPQVAPNPYAARVMTDDDVPF